MTEPTRSDRANPLATPAVSATDSGPSWHELAQSRREQRVRVGLVARLIFYFVLSVLTGIGVSAWVLVQRNGSVTNDGIAAIAQASAQSLSVAARDAIVTHDVDWLSALANDALRGRSDADPARIERVTIVDDRDVPLASAGAPVDGSASPAQMSVEAPIRSADGQRMLGKVRLTLGTALLEHARMTTYRAFGMLSVSIIAAALLIVAIYVRQSFRPLRQLEAAMRLVVAGDLNAVIPVRGGTKSVFKLAAAFNDLVSFARRDRQRTADERAAMVASINELQEKVASNTAQLEAANGRLQSEIAEKEDFLRAVSHDLNAPLRNIGGMVAMLMMKDKDKLPPGVIDRLERIKKNVDTETDLINELLELSRIKTRRQTLEVVDTESIVWDLRGLFDNDLKTRQIELTLETSLPTLYAERARIRQVFLNLIDNAIKYMGDDNPRREIRIGCRVSVTEAEFYVADSGVGIHPEDIDKVFCVFRRGRGEATQKVPGKGVGLSSVKSIIETYAGRIWVTSTLGEGTTFHFVINGKYVPVVSTQLPAEMQLQQQQQQQQAADTTGSATPDPDPGPPTIPLAA